MPRRRSNRKHKVPRRRSNRKHKVLILTEDLELPLLLTEEVPVNRHMRSVLMAVCLAMVVTLLVNIKLEFERQRIGVIDGSPVFEYKWVRPWEAEVFILPRPKPTAPYEEHYDVPQDQPQKKKFLTVWRVIRIAMQIYN